MNRYILCIDKMEPFLRAGTHQKSAYKIAKQQIVATNGNAILAKKNSGRK